MWSTLFLDEIFYVYVVIYLGIEIVIRDSDQSGYVASGAPER